MSLSNIQTIFHKVLAPASQASLSERSDAEDANTPENEIQLTRTSPVNGSIIQYPIVLLSDIYSGRRQRSVKRATDATSISSKSQVNDSVNAELIFY